MYMDFIQIYENKESKTQILTKTKLQSVYINYKGAMHNKIKGVYLIFLGLKWLAKFRLRF